MRDSIDSSAAETKTQDGVAALSPRVTPVGKPTSRLSPMHPCVSCAPCGPWHLRVPVEPPQRLALLAHPQPLRVHGAAPPPLPRAVPNQAPLLLTYKRLEPRMATSASVYDVCASGNSYVCRVRIGQGELGKLYGRSREAC